MNIFFEDIIRIIYLKNNLKHLFNISFLFFFKINFAKQINCLNNIIQIIFFKDISFLNLFFEIIIMPILY